MPNRPSLTSWFRPALPAFVCLIILSSCTRSARIAPAEHDGGAEPATAPPVAAPALTRLGSPSCSPDSIVEGADALDVLELAVGELVRATDQARAEIQAECGVSRRPLCAALFLIAATDPIVGFVREVGSTDLARLVALHDRVLESAIELARRSDHDRLEGALVRLAALDIAAAVERGDEETAALVVARAAPEIVAPISTVESGC